MRSTARLIPAAIAALAIFACAPSDPGVPVSNDGAADLTAAAAGSIPPGLPQRLTVGLFEDTGGTWMKSSGVPWDVRYRYFVKGWVNNWGYGAYDGSWGLGYLRECDASGFIPAVQYYQMNGEAGGAEGQFLAKAQNATTMKGYFGDFKILMQRARDFGKPVYVLLEADGFGFLEQQSGNNPNAYAAVAATGMPELAGLPDTVAGWGMAFLAIRQAVGASNVILGVHISAWASGKDIAYGSVSDPLGPEVDKVYAFLAPLGLASNQTGATFDVLVGDPLDRDSGYYQVALNDPNRWWDPSDGASISSRSFNRYAEWLRSWNAKAAKRWVLWQIPLGNSNHLDVCNSGGARQGYKDNRAEYFFGSGTTDHLARFAQDGVIALLFGAGAGCQSSYGNDIYTDGRSFIQSRVGAFYSGGGLPDGGIVTDGGTPPDGGSDAGTPVDGGSDGGTPADGGTVADPGEYNFESGTQGWSTSGRVISGVVRSTARAWAGTSSLAVNFGGGPSGSQTVRVGNPPVPAGATVTFRVWIPAGSALSSVQPYVLQGAAGGWTWTGNWRAVSSLTAGGWNAIPVTVPAGAATPLYELGVQFTTQARWSGTAYVDSVRW